MINDTRHINSDTSLRNSLDIDDAEKALSQSRWSYIGIAFPLIGMILAIFSFRNLKGLPRIGSMGQIVHKAKLNASIGLGLSIFLMMLYNGIAFMTYDTAKQNSQNNGQSITSTTAFENSSSKNLGSASILNGNSNSNTNTNGSAGTSQNTKPTSSSSNTESTVVSSATESIQAINDRYNAKIKAIDDAAKAQGEASSIYLQCKTDKQNALVSVNQQLADLNTKLIEASSYSSPYLNAYQTEQLIIQKKSEINSQIYTVQAQKNSISTQFSC